MKTNTTNHPNLISAMEYTNNVCALLVALELSAEQLMRIPLKKHPMTFGTWLREHMKNSNAYIILRQTNEYSRSDA